MKRTAIDYTLVLVLGAAIAGGAGCAGEDEGSSSAIGSEDCPLSPSLLQVPPACNIVANNAPAVPFKPGIGTLPSPAGGLIRDGLYQTTASAGWGAVTPVGRKSTLVVSNHATRFLWNEEVLDAEAKNVTMAYRLAATTRVVGTQIEVAVDCSSVTPAPVPAALNFTGSGAQLQLMMVTGSNVMVTSYTRTGCP